MFSELSLLGEDTVWRTPKLVKNILYEILIGFTPVYDVVMKEAAKKS